MKNIVFLFFVTLFFTGCNSQQKMVNKPTVTVSIIPQQFFVNQIAGSWLSVNVMIPPGGSPATYEPTPRQMKDLSKSEIYFQLGHIAFEKAWKQKLKSVSKETKFVDTSQGLNLIEEQELEEEHSDHHEHGHSHEGFNPHIWLSPSMVKSQANIIYQTLAKKYPEHQSEMKLRLDRFLNQCDSVHLQLQTQLAPSSGKSFLVYHPVWSYLAHDYNLHEVAIEYNGKEATADKLKNIIDFAKKSDLHLIFVQKEFNDNQARTIANEINGEVVQMNPLDYNWFSTMKVFGEAFEN